MEAGQCPSCLDLIYKAAAIGNLVVDHGFTSKSSLDIVFKSNVRNPIMELNRIKASCIVFFALLYTVGGRCNLLWEELETPGPKHLSYDLPPCQLATDWGFLWRNYHTPESLPNCFKLVWHHQNPKYFGGFKFQTNKIIDWASRASSM